MPDGVSNSSCPRLALVTCSVFENEISLHSDASTRIVENKILEIGLHDRPDQLRATLQKEIERLDARDDIDAIGLVYGLCGRGTDGLRSGRHPLVIARAHDCITLFLGSKERYATMQAACPGAYFYTPGWNRARRVPGPERLEWLKKDLSARFDPEDVEYLIDVEKQQWADHSQAIYLELGTADAVAEEQYARNCAQWLGWKFEHPVGDASLLRDLLHGHWDDVRFQVIPRVPRFVSPAMTAFSRMEDFMSELDVEVEGIRRHLIASGLETELDLASLLASKGIPLNTRCGRRGWCHGCEIELLEGRVLGSSGLVQGPARVRSCQAHLSLGGEPLLRVPHRARLALAPQVGESFHIDPIFELDPPFDCMPGNRDTAFAVDIGTTTVVVLLVDLFTGRILSRAGAYNAQIRFGDNVLTRIMAAGNPRDREALRRAILDETIAPLLLRACEKAGRPLERLAGGSMAGNMTMLHLLLGEDPTSMGTAPFTPRFLESRRLDTAQVGLVVRDALGLIDPNLPILLLPGFSAYVGADISAGIYATAMLADPEPSLFVDIGTNGEIALQVDGRILVTATAAGPAFEGAGLLSGTRAHAGAVCGIRLPSLSEGFKIETIGELPVSKSPGFCGTAYIDFLAEARRVGLLMTAGRFDKVGFAALPSQHRVAPAGGLTVAVAGDLRISEADIAHLLNAKAAVAAGIDTLLLHAGLKADALSRVYVAGGFGMHLNIRNTLAIGMLPGFREEQISVVGNTSLAGALLAVLDRTAISTMEALRQKVEVVELNHHASFENSFIDHLSLP